MNELIFLGSGDAFGSGGRLQSCILVKTSKHRFLLDCGATSLIALRKHQVDPNDIDLILVTNLHGDHFGGIPYFVIDAQLNRKRTKPLVIAGPPGIKAKIPQVMESVFPGSAETKTRFTMDIVEMEPGKTWYFMDLIIHPFPVIHAPGDPHLALRIECEGKNTAYSGDTEWTNKLLALAEGADLLIVESYFFAKKIKYHLDYQTLAQHFPSLKAKAIVITHMSEDMLGNLDRVVCNCAEDGKLFEL